MANDVRTFRVIVCGSRDWDDPRPIRLFFKGLRAWLGRSEGVEVIHGDARGADKLAAAIAPFTFGNAAVRAFPADWRGQGRGAGHIRNKLMLEEQPFMVVAFKDGFDHTLQRGGTENMVRIAKEAGVSTYVVSHG